MTIFQLLTCLVVKPWLRVFTCWLLPVIISDISFVISIPWLKGFIIPRLGRLGLQQRINALWTATRSPILMERLPSLILQGMAPPVNGKIDNIIVLVYSVYVRSSGWGDGHWPFGSKMIVVGVEGWALTSLVCFTFLYAWGSEWVIFLHRD